MFGCCKFLLSPFDGEESGFLTQQKIKQVIKINRAVYFHAPLDSHYVDHVNESGCEK